MPHVKVTFTTVGAELRAVTAVVTELSGTFLARHTRLVEEFEAPDVWPKHVVVEYLWEQEPDSDVDAGLVAVLASCAPLQRRPCAGKAAHVLASCAPPQRCNGDPRNCSLLAATVPESRKRRVPQHTPSQRSGCAAGAFVTRGVLQAALCSFC